MAVYSMITKDGWPQRDADTGQIELYETEKDAQVMCRTGHNVEPVHVSRTDYKASADALADHLERCIELLDEFGCSLHSRYAAERALDNYREGE